MKKDFKVAIVGSGKLAYAFCKGFINYAKIEPRDILVVAPRLTSDLSNFKALYVTTSTDFEDVINTETIVLAVTPQATAQIIAELVVLDFSQSKYITHSIVSFISMVPFSLISKELEKHQSKLRIVVATGNTNIAYGKGIIYASDSLPIVFKTISKIEVVTTKEVQKAIVAIGSMNAFDAKALKICFNFWQRQVPLGLWLRGLLEFLKKYETNSIFPETYINIKTYLEIKINILRKNSFGYDPQYAKHIAVSSLVSTIEALIASKNPSRDSIDKLIKTVVTEGGCTAEGLDNIKNVFDLTSKDLLTETFEKVHIKAASFRKVIQNSFNVFV